MSVLKVKKDSVWEEVGGISGHTHTTTDITNFPSSLPADGGNADTVDGKHASDFAAATDMTIAQSDISDLQTKVGDLSGLNTVDKSSLVAAINEVLASGGGAGSMDLRVAGGYVQYSRDGGMTWTNLIAMEDIKGDPGAPGADGKSAYQYAQDGGYTGTETEFAAKLAAEIPTVDSTLTQSGQAADAAEVGNRLSSISSAVGEAEQHARVAQECAQAMAGTFDFTGYLRYQIVDAVPATYDEGVLYIVTTA